jgi:hypothetical protein
MMPISDVDGYPSGHFGEVYHQLIRPAVEASGYECHRADTTSAAHMIQLEIVTLAATADLCICDLSTANPNVLFEYGIRQAFDKPTVLIRDDRTRRLFDVTGFRDIEYDSTLRIANTLASREKIQNAIGETAAASEDGKQIFSLVKLMQLTRAATLPDVNLDPVQAQIQLLAKKVETLSLSVADSVRPVRRANTRASVGLSVTGGAVEVRSGGTGIVKTDEGRMFAFGSMKELFDLPFIEALPSKEQEHLLNVLVEHEYLNYAK